MSAPWRWPARVIEKAGVEIDVLDVGGGFPVSYPGVTPPPLDDFMAAIARGFAKLALPAAPGCGASRAVRW